MASWGYQFSSGDQTLTNRKEFWRSGFSKCPVCQKSNIKRVTEVAGCRHNGDGYGTEVFTCCECSWTTSFQYDEASEDCYYYETRGWRRGSPAPVAIPPKREMNDEEKTKFRRVFGLVGREAAIHAIHQSGFEDADVKLFFEEQDLT